MMKKIKFNKIRIHNTWCEEHAFKRFFLFPTIDLQLSEYDLPYKAHIGFCWLIWGLFIEIHYKK